MPILSYLNLAKWRPTSQMVGIHERVVKTHKQSKWKKLIGTTEYSKLLNGLKADLSDALDQFKARALHNERWGELDDLPTCHSWLHIPKFALKRTLKMLICKAPKSSML